MRIAIADCVRIYLLYSTIYSKKDKYRREGKGYRCCLGDVYLNAALSILQQGLFEQKFWGELIFDGGLAWYEPDDHPFFQSINFAKKPLF